MPIANAYHRWVEWSAEDQTYIGGCHGPDPVRVYAELCGIINETVADLEHDGKPLPEIRTRPLAAV